MKVVCDSCQAKYQVPDERVAGKKLKIRCKRCGATVLIRGDLLGSGTETGMPAPSGTDLSQTLTGALGSQDVLDMERTSIPLSSGAHDEDYEWHVSLDGDTQGPFSTAALQSWLNTTPSGWDAHVWREGFPDWIDARACAELGPAPATPAMPSLQHGGEDELPTQTFNSGSFDGAAFMADIAAPRNAPSVAPRARTRDHVGGGYDAHEGAIDSAPRIQPSQNAGFYSSLASSGSARPISSAPAAPMPTGATGATYTPGPNPGFASGEASGLIDIRALASLARQSTTQITKNADASGGAAMSAKASAALSNPAARNGTGPNGAIKSSRPDPSGLSYGQDDSRAQPTGAARFDSIAPVTHSVSSNAALPLAILGGCALVAAAVLAAVLFNKKPTTDSATAPATTQEHQQSESAATAMPNEQGTNSAPATENKNEHQEHKAAPSPDGHQPSSAVGPEDEPTVAPASVEEAEADELSKAKRPRVPQPGQAQAAEAEKEPPAPVVEAKPKKEEKPAAAAQEGPEAMLADRAKPVKQAPPPLVVTPLGAAEESKPADSAKAVSEPDTSLAAKPQPAPKQAPSGNRSLDDLLANASGDKPASTAASAPAPTNTPAATPAATQAAAAEAEDLPEQPSRDETLAAMRGVEAAVRGCAGSETVTGTAEVAINVAGATGRVTSATVTGITGTVGSCIARAVRNARFPRFSKSAFSIKYPYRF